MSKKTEKQFKVSDRVFDNFADAEMFAKLDIKGHTWGTSRIWELVAVVKQEDRDDEDAPRKIVTEKV